MSNFSGIEMIDETFCSSTILDEVGSDDIWDESMFLSEEDILEDWESYANGIH